MRALTWAGVSSSWQEERIPNQSVERDLGLAGPLRSAANPKRLPLDVRQFYLVEYSRQVIYVLR
jgi:hypothetical protein